MPFDAERERRANGTECRREGFRELPKGWHWMPVRGVSASRALGEDDKGEGEREVLKGCVVFSRLPGIS